jgi:hypothetical protein
MSRDGTPDRTVNLGMPQLAASEETVIWRYMDLQRFVVLMVRGAVRFTKAAEFHDDPWEGFCRVTVPSTVIPETHANETVQLNSKQFLKLLVDYSSKYLEHAREHLYVTSWSLCVDSMALWKIYSANAQGLALQSSVGRCKQALQFNVRSDQYTFGCVEYANDIESSPKVQGDFTSRIPLPGPELWKHVISKGFLKRSGYEFEEEWRGVLYQEGRPADTGVDIPCQLDTLINSVIVGPNADAFMCDVVEELMSKFGIKKTVSRSNLLMPPPKQRLLHLD